MGENEVKLSDREKSLLDDNINLKGQLKELEKVFNTMQGDFTRSIKMRERLDSLCKVLQQQTQEIKDESAAQIGQAEGQGNRLAREVADNMEMMEGVNKTLNDIMSTSLTTKQENVELTGQVSILKQQYDDRQDTMTNDLQKASDDLIKTKTELAQLRLKTATEREKAYGEMHQLANTLVENKKQMKNAKESELELRLRLQSYDEKFTSLQSSLVSTNSGYSAFTGEMEQVAKKTKDLEKDTQDWQKKWEVNNIELMGITKSHEQIQNEVTKLHENLIKMTTLYQQLDKEKSQLLKKLGRDQSIKPAPKENPSPTKSK